MWQNTHVLGLSSSTCCRMLAEKRIPAVSPPAEPLFMAANPSPVASMAAGPELGAKPSKLGRELRLSLTEREPRDSEQYRSTCDHVAPGGALRLWIPRSTAGARVVLRGREIVVAGIIGADNLAIACVFTIALARHVVRVLRTVLEARSGCRSRGSCSRSELRCRRCATATRCSSPPAFHPPLR